MVLREWMDKLNIDIIEVADTFDVSIHAVKKWLRGERIPRPSIQRKIKKATKGAVTPSDWIK
jgi:transcriptional regulator with XRE-family HTH domain